MSKREQELQRQLDDAQRRIAASAVGPAAAFGGAGALVFADAEHFGVEQRAPSVEVTVEAQPARNSLQTISDWWHGGSSAWARSRHMRVNY